MEILPGSLFTIGGLPLHPLVVHAAVVLLPLSAIALTTVVVVRKWRRNYGWLAVIGTIVGTGAVVASKLTGEQLAATIGLPVRHALFGTLLAVSSVTLSAAAILWWAVQYRGREDQKDSGATRILGVITAALAASTLILVVLTGHSGAEAAWGDRVIGRPSIETVQSSDNAGAQSEGTVKADPDSSADTNTGIQVGFTMEEVQQHSSTESCWAAVNGEVYDLTDWIGRHPGGAAVIEQLCGTDATAAFESQHGGSGRPNRELQNFKIGDLR